MVCRSDESRHLLLPFPVLRFLRLIRSLRSLRSLQTLRTIRSIRSIRETRVQKQNVRFVFRFVYSFERSLCRVWTPLCRVLNARCVGFSVGFVYSLKHKLYISQYAENQRNKEQNVGFVYSLQSFLFPLLFTYSVR